MGDYWEDENTLVIQLIYIGELGDQEVRVVFSTDAIDVLGKDVINGQKFKLHGRRVG